LLVDEVYDLVVIGGGTAGIIAAKTAAGLGGRVVLAEAGRTGGDCLWTGCVPSKALLAAAAAAHRVRAGGPGVAPSEPKVDFTAVMAHVHAAIAHIEPDDSPDALRDAGVEVVPGQARFAGPREVRVTSDRMRFRHAVIATGSTPALPPIPGLAEVAPLTSDTVWDLTELPARLAVLGGGPIGCELGQAFARLGADVTIIEAVDRLVPREEPQAGTILATRLATEGVHVLTGTTVTAATGRPGEITLAATGPDGPLTVAADAVLVATGRRPRTAGLDLDLAGVGTDKRGYVVVDRRLRTANPRVYAAGDVTGAPAFTHIAAMHGSIAASNAILAPLRGVDHERMPWVTFTDPEIAHVGLTEAQARDRHGDAIRVRSLPHCRLDRAVTEADTDGFTHVVLDPQGRVLGATIVAPRAGEMITELVELVARRGRLRSLASIVHPYPSWSQAVWTTAVADATAALTRPPARAAVDVLRRLRRVSSRS
jgi:pyruvate/2-oxoglutarate dehydrogenase complex dihydrolipoamide dehydrogenase (E3) component